MTSNQKKCQDIKCAPQAISESIKKPNNLLWVYWIAGKCQSWSCWVHTWYMLKYVEQNGLVCWWAIEVSSLISIKWSNRHFSLFLFQYVACSVLPLQEPPAGEQGCSISCRGSFPAWASSVFGTMSSDHQQYLHPLRAWGCCLVQSTRARGGQ